MHRNRPITVHATILCVAFLFALFGGPAAGTVEGADKKDVTLTLSVDSSGEPTVTVHPETAELWRNKPDNPKKINWIAVNRSQHSELFWEIRYDPGKGGASEDYFGDVDLACGETENKVKPAKKPEFPYAQWPYSITVFSCVGGVKAQQLTAMDPRIIWKD